MVKIDIITGFLGAGKTTLINKLLEDGYSAEKPMIIENEFGEVPVDKDLISDKDVQVKLLISGCICCSLKGDFVAGIKDMVTKYAPARIIIEPTGLAELEDVLDACEDAAKLVPLEINCVITVINARNFLPLVTAGGEFFRRQVRQARFALLSCTQLYTPEETRKVKQKIHELNPRCTILDGDWSQLDSLYIMASAEQAQADFVGGETAEAEEKPSGHMADSFTYLPCFPRRSYSKEELDRLTERLGDEKYGQIFRAKGFLKSAGGGFELLEYVYGAGSHSASEYGGLEKFIVIGKNLDKSAIDDLMANP